MMERKPRQSRHEQKRDRAPTARAPGDQCNCAQHENGSEAEIDRVAGTDERAGCEQLCPRARREDY